MNQPLWEWAEVPAGRGQLRRHLAARIDAARAAGQDVPEDLAFLAGVLADRIDDAVARRVHRGFVILSSEYRAARDQLFAGLGDPTGDSLDAALADFMAAEADAGH